MDETDIKMLASDIAGEFSSIDYHIDVTGDAVEPNLPAFIEACLATQAELDKKEA
jgi:hypothetical protein